VGTSLFEDVPNLSQLRELVRRPQNPSDRSFYLNPLDPKSIAKSFLQDDKPVVETTRALEIFNNLYGSEGGAVVVERPGELDDEIFTIWSQQWPRLRRNFKFQTAASRGDIELRTRFDLRLRLRLSSDYRVAARTTPWLEAAVSDLNPASDHRLRHFLWRYGTDVRKQRGSFRPLCKIFLLDQRQVQSEGTINFSEIAEWFPDGDDASTLKRDLVDGELLAEHQLEILSYLLKQDRGGSFPLPSSEGVAKLSDLWPTQADKMLELAEYAVSHDSDLASSVKQIVLTTIPASNFWAITRRFPGVRRSMIQNRPNLLDTEEIADLDSSSFEELLELVPANHPVGASLVRRLLLSADVRTARTVLRHFPTQAASEIISAVNENGWRPARKWLSALAGEPSLLLNSQTMAAVERTSTLYRLAEELRWITSDVVTAGCGPWLSGLAGAVEDLSSDENDILHSFFIALAIEAGGSGAQDLLERYFSPIHERILKWYLPWKANEILVERLPNLGWGKNWDTGLRLRLGVTQAYVRHGLDPGSFATLSRDKRVQESLKAAAKEVSGGRLYASAIS
jgi:hypothetical protein